MTNNHVLLIWCGLMGLTVGSFLNVVVYRLPRKCMSICGARSLCPTCRKMIPWYDNIPVVSYLLLRGRCSNCRAPISPRYMLVELLTGALFVALGWKYLVDWTGGGFVAETWPLFAIYAVYVSALIACTFIDIDLRIIPNEISLGGMALVPVISFFVPALQKQGLQAVVDGYVNFPWVGQFASLPWGENIAALACSLLGLLFGGGLIYVVAVFGRIIFRKEAMGGGDLKLLAMIGAVAGWQGALVVFLLACFVGAILGVIVMLFTKDHYMPFGPYLALGAAAYIFVLPILVGLYDWYIGLLMGQA